MTTYTQNTLLSKKALLAVGIEGTYGTLNTVTSAATLLALSDNVTVVANLTSTIKKGDGIKIETTSSDYGFYRVVSIAYSGGTSITLDRVYEGASDSGTGVIKHLTSVLCTLPEISFEGEDIERDYARQHTTKVAPYRVLTSATITFSTELKGPGASTEDGSDASPELNPLFLGAGHYDKTAFGSGTYGEYGCKYDAEVGASLACELYLDNQKFVITGGIADYTIKLEAGKVPMIDWTVKGILVYSGFADGEAVPKGKYDSRKPGIVENMGFTFGGDTAVPAGSLELSIGNEIQMLSDVSSAVDGGRRYYISGRNVNGSFNPLVEGSTMPQDYIKNWFKTGLSDGPESLSVTIQGRESDNSGDVLLTLGAGSQINSLAFSDDNGMRRFDLAFEVNREPDATVTSDIDDSLVIKIGV